MAGKYAAVIDSLPKLAGEEPAYQEKINAVKAAILAEPGFTRYASTFVTMYKDLRRGDQDAVPVSRDERDALIARFGKDGLEALLSECNLRITAVEQLMVDQYEIEGVTSMKLDTGGSLGMQMEPYAQVQDRDECRKWCIAEGLENLMMVPWATINSLTKQRLLDGQPEPPGVKAYAKVKFVLRSK
jgi:hypothetical protein